MNGLSILASAFWSAAGAWGDWTVGAATDGVCKAGICAVGIWAVGILGAVIAGMAGRFTNPAAKWTEPDTAEPVKLGAAALAIAGAADAPAAEAPAAAGVPFDHAAACAAHAPGPL